MVFLDISFDFNLVSIDVFSALKHFGAILSECSLKSSRVCLGLSYTKNEIDRGPFHRVAKRPWAGKWRSVIQGRQK